MRKPRISVTNNYIIQLKHRTKMKKIAFSLAAFAALSLSATTVQDPPPTQVNIDRSCPASITAGTQNGSNSSMTYTENKSKGYDARTTVTDSKGNNTVYYTPAGQTSSHHKSGDTQTGNVNIYKGSNSNVSKIEVTCSPKE